MKKNLLITLGAAACTLISCNSRMPQISDEEGIKLAGEICTRHIDPSQFSLPNKFTITKVDKTIEEINTPGSGYQKTQAVQHTEMAFDLDNIYYKEYMKRKTESTEFVRTFYNFYDSKKGVYYEASNINGKKTRKDFVITPEEAKKKLENKRIEFIENITSHNFLLGFAEKIKEDKELHDKYKDEADQHYNYFVGSKNAKSLQYIEESKIKTSSKRGGAEFEGYIVHTRENIVENDLCVLSQSEDKTDLSNKDSQFYVEETTNKNNEVKYDICQIETINIEDYEKTE